MRVGMIAENPAESLAMASGIVPTPLPLAFFGMGLCRTLIAGVSLGVFDALRDRELTADEVAGATGCHPVGTAMLLSALNGFGYVRRRDGRFRNSAVTKKWLLEGGSIRDSILFLTDMWDQLGNLEVAVRTGALPRLHETEQPPGFWERYMRSLAAFARLAVPEINRKLKFANPPTRLIDVGGGHGIYSVGLCRKYPGLRAEILDLPQAAVHGRKIVAEEGFADRVTYREGDMRSADWIRAADARGYDAVLLFNVVHNATPEEARQMLNQAYDALVPGGTVAILEGAHERGRGDLSQSGGFNELFFFLVSGAQVYPEETIQSWLREAGFERLELSRLLFAPAVLMTGRRPLHG